MTSKERLVNSLKSVVLEKVEMPVQVFDVGDKVDFENEIVEILTTYRFNKQQMLDITALMFDEYVNQVTIQEPAGWSDTLTELRTCYSNFIRYYVAGYVAEYLLEEPN